jgi:CSLREA domain-containing protein
MSFLSFLRHLKYRSSRRPLRQRRRNGLAGRRFTFEPLEDRTLLATFVVQNTNDALFEAGSLRHAIAQANTNPGLDVITFDIPGAGVHTISPFSPLPFIIDPVNIDGTTQPGYAPGRPVIELDGSQAGICDGLRIKVGGNVIKGLIINSFFFDAITLIEDENRLPNGNSVIQGNFLGTDESGTVAKGNRGGIHIGQSPGNTIGGTTEAARNLISGNRTEGIFIRDALSTGNRIEGNFIGTDVTGMNALGNGENGVALAAPDVPTLRQGTDPPLGYASGTILGGSDPSARNVIAGNGESGVYIFRGSDNQALGNYIGVGADGTTPIPNGTVGPGALFGWHGVWIEGGKDNQIGSAEQNSTPNLISGNAGDGIRISHRATNNRVKGNYIGTDGNFELRPNGGDGVAIYDSSSNFVGGFTDNTGFDAGNFIAGNGGNGVSVLIGAAQLESNSNLIQGNLIVDNVGNGIEIRNDSTLVNSVLDANVIGGTDEDDGALDGEVLARNVISGNVGNGILLAGRGVDNTLIAGNYIGTDVEGLTALGTGNEGDGILILALEPVAVGPSNTEIGGSEPGAANIISGNNKAGVFIQGATRVGVFGNGIGVDKDGAVGLGNGESGVVVVDSEQVEIGGTIMADEGEGLVEVSVGNIIAGNDGDGVQIAGGATGVQVVGNIIGTGTDPTKPPDSLRNLRHGISVLDTAGVTIGGTTAAKRNYIVNSGQDGIHIQGAAAKNNVVLGNYIGVLPDGAMPLGNAGQGVGILDAPDNVIGGDDVEDGNLIHNNAKHGISLVGTASAGNRILNNEITSNIGNGVDISAGASKNFVGAVEQGNTIFDNRAHGIAIRGEGTSFNVVQGNNIGSLNSPGNSLGGVFLSNALSNTIGGLAKDAGNLISGNLGPGVTIEGGSDNVVQNNSIGIDSDGSAPVPNQVSGVLLKDAPNTLIGGETFEAGGNVISGNPIGVFVIGPLTFGAQIKGNYIGTDASAIASIGNDMAGVLIAGDGLGNGPSQTLIRGNVIAGNLQSGVSIVGGASDNHVEGNLIGTNAAQIDTIPNFGTGVLIVDSPRNWIGGSAALNVIAFTAEDPEQDPENPDNGSGISIRGAGSGENQVQLNIIHHNAKNGIRIGEGATNNHVGDQFFNSISNNGLNGVLIDGEGTSFNIVAGNFIGLNVDDSPIGNFRGVSISRGASHNTIGSATPGSGNIISANEVAGVVINSGAHNNEVVGNYIGTDRGGSFQEGLGSLAAIILSDAHHNVIGGPTESIGDAPGNRIHGSLASGILVSGATASENRILGNLIANNESGGIALLTNASNNTIGGPNNTDANRISDNEMAGVSVASGTGNAILRNRILDNGGLGIDLASEGITANDQRQNKDSDSGPNNLQNFPELALATVGGSRRIVGTLKSAATTTYVLEFFASGQADPSDFGEGDRFVTTTAVTTNASGIAFFDVFLPEGEVAGTFLTATATDPSGNTSEFSKAIRIETDTDGDGISDDDESLAPGAGGDGNGDGVPDLQQAHVASFPNAVTGAYITLEAPAGSALSQVRPLENPSPDDAPSTAFDAGFFDFTLTGVAPGSFAEVKVFLPAGSAPTSYHRYGPTPGNPTPHWYEWLYGGVTGAEISGNQITLHLLDGGLGDDDLAANGTIVDPGGPGFPLVFTVTTTHDSGPGSLRQAILDANSIPGADSINFNIGSGGVQTIVLLSALPIVADTLEIDGTTQPGYAGSPIIELSGHPVVKFAGSGLRIAASDTTVRGLAINQFTAAGIEVSANGLQVPSGVRIEDNFIGTDVTGTLPRGNRDGIFITAGAGHYLGGNLISGNVSFGVAVLPPSGPPVVNNLVVEGNLIGTDVTGTLALGNDFGLIVRGATGLRVGGTTPAARNVISGNRRDGIQMLHGGSPVVDAVVEGNFIGTDVSGTLALGNGAGVRADRATGLRIGGATPAARNVISANLAEGVFITLSAGIDVQGNFIGVGADGTAPLGNGANGVHVSASNVTVGGTQPGAGNIIAFNRQHGIYNPFTSIRTPALERQAFLGNSIHGNLRLGIDLSEANFADPNDGPGPDDGRFGRIGFSFIGAPNPQNHPVLVSANSAGGQTTISGYLNSRPNESFRIEFFSNTAVGPSGFAQGETFLGFTTVTTGADGRGQFIATLPVAVADRRLVTATATDPFNNTSEFSTRLAVGDVLGSVYTVNTTDDLDDGVADAVHTSLREAIHAANNHPGLDLIRFNIGSGPRTIVPAVNVLPIVTDPVVIDGTTQPGYAGAPMIELAGTGIDILHPFHVAGSAGLTVLTDNSTVKGFVINRFVQSQHESLGFSSAGGVALGVQGHGNVIEGNYIGTDISGTQRMANVRGLVVRGTGNQVGGATPAARNVISGMSHDPLFLDFATATVVQGNFIGTDATGTVALGNGRSSEFSTNGGIIISFGANNIVGGAASGAGNLICGDGGDGIVASSPGTIIQGNFIGTDVTGTRMLGVSGEGDGIVATGIIGGALPGEGNVVANSRVGIKIADSDFVVQGNLIGTDVTGTLDFGNRLDGIQLTNAVRGRIGGAAPGEGNVISGNGRNGILMTLTGQQTTFENRIQGNRIGVQADGISPLGNGADGIFVDLTLGPFRSIDNLIGGIEGGAGNTIAFNVGHGVRTLAARGFGILSNDIYSNGGLGIDLSGDGPTPNDPADTDIGDNDLQNFPVLTAAVTDGTQSMAEGTLNSTPGTLFSLQFFASPAADASGFGEGAMLLGSSLVATGADGNASFTLTFSTAVPAGQFITATATDPANNTSEFSRATQVVDGTIGANQPPVADAGGPYVLDEGSGLLLDATAPSDPDGDPLSYNWDVNGDGVFGDTAGIKPTLSWSQLQALGIVDGPSSFVIQVRIDDGQGHVVTSSPTSLMVRNVAPILNTPPDQFVTETEPVIFTGSFTDPGTADTHTLHWRIANVDGTTAAEGDGATIDFLPTDNGTRLVHFTVTDDDGGAGSTIALLFVANADPTVFIVGLPAAGSVGVPVHLTASVADISPEDTAAGFTYEWSVILDDNIEEEFARGTDAAFSFMPTVSGRYRISLTAFDKDGGSSRVRATLIVTESPIANAGPDQTEAEGALVTLNGSFVSSSPNETPTYLWQVASSNGQIVAAGHATSFSFTPNDNGSYTATFTVTTDDGVFSDSATVTVTNARPTAALAGPGSGTYGQPLNYAPSADDASSVDDAAGFQYVIQWGDGTPDTIVPRTAGNSSGASVVHTFAAAGQFSVQIISIDKDGDPSNVTTVPVTVIPAALVITAENKSKSYGAAMPALTFTASGFVNGDTPAVLTTLPTLATTATASSHVGNYPITASGATATSDYTITYVPGTLAVTPAALQITAENKSKVYGAPIVALTAIYEGLVNGDTPASLNTPVSLTTTVTAASSVGSYPITVSGAADPDYTITHVPGTYSVSPAPLSIKADDKSKPQGAVNPPLTFTPSGFVNGDTASNLATQPTLTTTATTESPPGTYPITAGGASSPNYTISYLAGTLTVTSVVTGGTIRGIEYLDVTGNGLSDDDTPLAGVQVYLDTNNNGALNVGEPATTSSSDGKYAFNGLAAGAYKIRQVVPAGHVRTAPAIADFYSVTLASGQTSSGKDFANAKLGDKALVADIVYVINGTTAVSELLDKTKEGDTIQASFRVIAGAGPHRYTLVSYTAPGPAFDPATAAQQKIFDSDSGVFGPGSYTLNVTIPHNHFQVDFVCGSAIDRFGPPGSNIFYSAQNRLLDYDNGGTHAVRSNGGTLSGYVYYDADNNGQYTGEAERPISGVTVKLSGAATQTVVTDVDGKYTFDNLPSGTYTITETQPASYSDGTDTLGTRGGSLQNDKFRNISLPAGASGANYNFGERQVVGSAIAGNQTGSTAFWKGASGQNLIKALNGGQNAKNLGNWLADNFDNLFGADAGSSNNLADKTNSQVASYVRTLISDTSRKPEAEALALALNVYVTTSGLAGTTATSYGFAVSPSGLGASTINVDSAGAALGLDNNAVLTISELLLRLNLRSRQGLIWDLDANATLKPAESVLRNQLNSVLTSTNQT